jgi:hypothetical protein
MTYLLFDELFPASFGRFVEFIIHSEIFFIYGRMGIDTIPRSDAGAGHTP